MKLSQTVSKLQSRHYFYILKITKGNNSANNVGGVTFLNLCTSSGHVTYFYQVLKNYLERYQSYRADTIFILKITKGE